MKEQSVLKKTLSFKTAFLPKREGAKYTGRSRLSCLFADLFRASAPVEVTTTLFDRVLCGNCLHVCVQQDTYQRQCLSCLIHEPAMNDFPKPPKIASVEFEYLKSRWVVPPLENLDVESLQSCSWLC